MNDCPNCIKNGQSNTAELFSDIYERGRSFASTTYEAETSRQLVGDTLYVSTELRSGAVEVLTPAAKRHRPPRRFSQLIAFILFLILATVFLIYLKNDFFFKRDFFFVLLNTETIVKLMGENYSGYHFDSIDYYYGLMFFVISAFSTFYLLPISIKNDGIKLWKNSYRCKNCDLAFQIIPPQINLWSWGRLKTKSFFAKIYWYFGWFVFSNLLLIFAVMNYSAAINLDSPQIKITIFLITSAVISYWIWNKHFKPGLIKLLVIFAITLCILGSIFAA